MDPLTVLLALGATLCWSSTWILMKAGVNEMDRTAFGVLRPWIGLLFLLPLAGILGGFTFGSPRLVLVALSSGFLNAYAGVGLFYYALSKGSLHKTNILSGTGPFWGAVSAILVLSEPARWEALVAAILIVGGTYFLARRQPEEVHNEGARPTLAALAAGVLFGFTAAVPSKYCLSQGMSQMAYQLVFMLSAGIAWSLAALPKLLRRQLAFTRKGIGIAWASAFTGLFAGWVLWLLAIERTDASVLAPFNGLTMLFAVLLGALFFRERITRRILIGGLLMLAGVTLVSVFAR